MNPQGNEWNPLDLQKTKMAREMGSPIHLGTASTNSRREWKQLTSRPDQIWPELWKSMGKHAKLKEKQKWSEEKLHLENARKLRGIYFIDPEDKEFKETIKNARKKLEMPMAPAVPCKTSKKSKHGETRGKTNEFKSKLACILEASGPTRLRMEETLPNYHEDHIAGRGDESLQHHNLVHKFISMPPAIKIPPWFVRRRSSRPNDSSFAGDWIVTGSAHESDGGRCCGGWRLQSLLFKVQRAGKGRRPPGNPYGERRHHQRSVRKA